jgi:Tfp pilus assembly protein PilX
MRRRARGFLLLPMALTLVAVGALAYAMTRDAGTSITRVDAAYDTEVARYLAESAVNLARWKNNQTNCSSTPATFPPTDLYRYNLASGNVGTTPADRVGTMTLNNISVVGNNSSSDKGNIIVDVRSATPTTPPVSSGATTMTPLPASAGIVRTVFRYNLTSVKQTTITGGGGADTYIYTGANPVPKGAAAYMELTDNGPGDQSYGLLRFSLSTLPKNALVKDATLRLTLTNVGIVWGGLPTLDIYRVTTPWDPATATWALPWSKAGGDIANSRVATSFIDLGVVYDWRIDTLVAGWMDGTLANNGLLLKPNYLYKTRFSAFGSGGADDPQLTVTYYERCT